MLTAVDLRFWVIIYLNRNENVARQLQQALQQACQGIGMNASQPQMIALPNERTETFVEAMRRAITPQLQLAVSIMPSQRDDRYAAIKRLCYVEMPVASQVRGRGCLEGTGRRVTSGGVGGAGSPQQGTGRRVTSAGDGAEMLVDDVPRERGDSVTASSRTVGAPGRN